MVTIYPNLYLTYPTLLDIQDIIYENFNKIIITASIKQILKRLNFKIVVATPMEKERYTFRKKEIEEYFNTLKRLLVNVPVGWLFNVDETGQQDFVDAKKIHIIVPENINSKDIKYPVERNGKRSTLIHCICSDGTFLKPFFVLPRKTIDTEIFDILDPKSIHFDYSPPGFVNNEIFCKWFDYEFLKSIEEKRKLTGYQGKAILLMDGFSAHHKCIEDEQRKKKIEDLNVHILFIPPHSSNLLQPLDLVTFSLQKRWKKNIKINKNFSYQSKQIIEAYESILRASSPSYIADAFKRAGIIKNRLNIVNSQKIQDHKVSKVFASAYIDMLFTKCSDAERKDFNEEIEDERRQLFNMKTKQLSIQEFYNLVKNND